MAAEIRVEVVFATANQQRLISITLPGGATAGDAISESSMARFFPGENLESLQVGVWGRLVKRDHVLADGDRVEIYRTLELDPREARRQLALSGKTMGSRPTD